MLERWLMVLGTVLAFGAFTVHAEGEVTSEAMGMGSGTGTSGSGPACICLDAWISSDNGCSADDVSRRTSCPHPRPHPRMYAYFARLGYIPA